jgi:serine/threonine protein kinase
VEKPGQDDILQQPAPPKLRPIRVIGNGAFGYVFEAIDLNRNCKVALKRTQKAGNVVSREFEVLTMLKEQANVVQLLDFFYTIDAQRRVIQNTVLEFCDNSLMDILDDHKNDLPMASIKKYVREIFTGLENMHGLGICHRDLKPENILVKDGAVKICDLGSSKILAKDQLNTPYVVSRYYRAPELILACNEYDFSIDIWATGCIIFELLLKTPMFPGESEGLQIVEMQQILGPPSATEITHYQ